MRYAFALDLHDDARLIEEYERYHREVWPEVISHLRAHGVLGMEIFRLGTRLFMVLETDEAKYDAARLAAASHENPRVKEWETLMWRFQAATPWTAPGDKWTPMRRMFDMNDTPAASVDGRRRALMLVTSLFFMWGLAYGLLDVLNKHFQETLGISRARSAYLQAAYFGAYFLMARPAAWLMSQRGYKFGILLGLCLYALGALLFVPATLIESFAFFLLALFVIASGLACLETAANPYVTILGDPAHAERRLNFSQSFNGLGAFLGPLIGGQFFFSATASDPISMRVEITYGVIAAVVLGIAALIKHTPMPEIQEPRLQAEVVGEQSLWSQRHFVGAVVAQFFYVAAQVGVGAFFINYVTEAQKGIDSRQASFLLSIGMLAFLVGRFASTAMMRRVNPSRLLTLYALVNVALSMVVASAPGVLSIVALLAIFFFMSIMFPTLFALGVARLGVHTKTGAAYLIMSIVGGAIVPYFMGLIADARGTARAYWIPVGCFAVVAWYGARYRR